MQSRLEQELYLVGRRIRKVTQLTVLATIWLVFFIVGWALSQGAPLFGLSPAVTSLGFLAISLVCSILFCMISRNWFSDHRWLANQIESSFPELDSRLLTSLDQLEGRDPAKVGFLQHMVLMQTISHSARNRWELVVSPAKIVFSQLAAILGFILLLVGSIMIANGDTAPLTTVADKNNDQQLTAAGQNLPVELLEVEPGNTEVEKGTMLTVLAKFKSSLPEKADLVYEFATGADQETGSDFFRVPMTASFDDPVFAGQIPDVKKPLTYWVEYEDKASDRFYATVFEYPELQQLDFELDFPDYTGLPNKTVNDARRLSALKGTKVRFVARLNKTVTSCELVLVDPNDADAEPGENSSIKFTENAEGEPVYHAEMEVSKTARYQLVLVDDANRQNKLPPEIQINALDNKPPKIRITMPSRDIEVSPLEEMETAAKLSDDYGIERTGITFSLAGQNPTEVELGKKLIGKKEHEISHELDFESLNVEPKQMVSYFFWAEDLVADGKSRRVMSDMFFAEVREFEKIFRQGQSQNQQQQRRQQQQQNQQQQRQLGELRQLQKEIINATWKLIRRETDETTSDDFSDDVGVIQDSQQSAIDLVDRAVQQQNRPEAAALGTQIKTAMNEVILTLQRAKTEDSAVPLVDAISREQLVYQLILKLATDESQVQRQQNSSSSSSQSQQNRSQQQLQQLQLNNDRNRYEQENQAKLREQQEQSENRQALNRLKELARRQEDINKQLEQLQTALEQAKSEEEKKEIERRLKRLREQQEELLRDLDELKDQTEQNRDNEMMQKANEELEKARENVRRSAEALKENQVSQAAAAGNRAQKQFEDLREEFRKNNANEFADEMKAMSDKANELKSKQDEIADRLKKIDENPKKSLRSNDDRKEIAKDLIDQRKKYDSILEDIKDVVRKAEDSEPLLSQELYDTFRDTSKSITRSSIDTTENLLSRGFVTEARKTEENANQGIDDLNQRIQKAAENIVGDEADSLRRAEETLRKLSNQINSEIEQNLPNGATPPNSDNPAKGKQDAKDGKFGDAPDKQGAKSDSKRNPKGGKQADGKQKSAQKGSPAKGSKSGDSDKKNPGSSKGGQPGKESQKQGSQKQGPQKQGSQKQGSKGQGSQGKNSPGKNSPGKNSPGKNSQGKSGDSPSKSQQDSKNGSPGKGSPKGSGKQSGQPNSNRQPSQGARNNRNRSPLDGIERMLGGPSNGGAPRPITGDEYRQFSNELREIEELLEDPKLRARAAEIREKAKEIRVDMKRHSKKPNWDVVQEFIAEPLDSLRSEVARQLLLKENREALVPIDRDPVPTIFEDQVQQYYKELSEVNK